MGAATLDFPTEGLRTMDFSFLDAIADVRISGVNIGEAQIESPLRSLAPAGMETVSARLVERKRGLPRLRKKASTLYQVTPLVTVALATTALVFPRLPSSTPTSGVIRTPIYHFDRREDNAAVTTDDIVTAQQIRAFDELLAVQVGPELDVHLRDWP